MAKTGPRNQGMSVRARRGILTAMAKPKPKGKKKGYSASSGGMDGVPIGAALMAGAAMMVVLAIFALSLKSQLVKPGRIVAAAENSGLFDKMPRLMYSQVFGGKSLLNPKKQLMLKADEVQELSEAMFDPDWVVEEFETIIWDAAEAIKAGDSINPELYLDEIKPEISNALIAIVKKKKDNLVGCSGNMKAGRSLCIPKDVSRGLFLGQMAPEIKKVVDKFPSRYPLLPRGSAEQIKDATGIFGTIGGLGFVFLVLALGMAGGAWKMYDEDGPAPKLAVGGGLAIGGAVLFLVVVVIKGAIGAGTGALARSLEASYAVVVEKFFDSVIGGGFKFAIILAGVSLVVGAGMAYYAHSQS